MKKIFTKIKAFLKLDIVVRLVKTFCQAFGGVLITVSFTDLTNLDTLKVLIIAGASAGISACWNIIKVLVDKKLNK